MIILDHTLSIISVSYQIQLPTSLIIIIYVALSENSVPLNPMVLLIRQSLLNGYFIGNINPIFRQTHVMSCHVHIPFLKHK